MTWTKNDLLILKQRGFDVKGLEVNNQNKATNLIRKAPAKGLSFIEGVLILHDVKYIKEHKVVEGRAFRFDIAIPGKKVAIEFEGIFSEKSRHTTLTGYSKDTTKYNIAQLNGWKVLRYTALNYKDFEKDIKKIIYA